MLSFVFFYVLSLILDSLKNFSDVSGSAVTSVSFSSECNIWCWPSPWSLQTGDPGLPDSYLPLISDWPQLPPLLTRLDIPSVTQAPVASPLTSLDRDNGMLDAEDRLHSPGHMSPSPHVTLVMMSPPHGQCQGHICSQCRADAVLGPCYHSACSSAPLCMSPVSCSALCMSPRVSACLTRGQGRHSLDTAVTLTVQCARLSRPLWCPRTFGWTKKVFAYLHGENMDRTRLVVGSRDLRDSPESKFLFPFTIWLWAWNWNLD